MLVASTVALLAFMALVLVARALKRRGERAEAREAQEPHARAQDELEQLFDAPARKDGSRERRSRRSR